jgi:Na+/melibiose symporter-like transporter
VRGEGYLQLSKQLSGLPITILYPFLGVITKKLGGPKKTMIIDILLRMASFTLRYFAGYKSVFGLVMYILADTIFMTAEPLGFYADHVLNYEMLDYVEWKTGVRSEGIAMAFRSFTNKIVANNINSFTGNAFAAWTGIHKIDINDPNLVLPERYVKWVWPMVNLMPVIDNAIFLVARIAFPYDPKEKDVIEADLKERRALAAKMKEDMEMKA